MIMSEKQSKTMGSNKPVPMKLFSSWEVDRTPPNCIPRLCSLTLTRLVVTRSLPTSELGSVIIAVKMAGSRRTLRSNEIPLMDNALINTELELHFSLQYPHFLKRDENRLVIMLQRRKKYKNRTILGYKTLAEGTIDMALVLQRSVDLDLDLFAPDGGNKENHEPIAKVTIMGIASQPVDDLEGDRKGKQGKPRQGHDFSDEEDDFSSHSSDSPPDDVILRKNSKSLPHNRNLKQKIVNLLRKFKATEEGHRGVEAKSGGPTIGGVGVDIDELFDELDGLSEDSEPDADTLSVGSFPKPVLPPFFASSRSLIQQNPIPEKPTLTSDEQRDSDSWTEPDQQSGESPKMSMRSPGMSPSFITVGSSLPLMTTQNCGRVNANDSSAVNNILNNSGLHQQPHNKSLLLSSSLSTSTKPGSIADQVAKVLTADEAFPDLVVLVSLESPLGPGVFSTVVDRGIKVLGIESEAELRVAFPHIVGKVQKFCNNNAKAPSPVTIVAIGSEAFLNAITKNFVTQLSSRPHDWQSYFSFLYAPFATGGSVWKLLCHKDTEYGQTFNDFTERSSADEMALRILSYTKTAMERRLVVNVPIAEAMITYKDADESSQVFVPFVSEVRLSVSFSAGVSMDQQEPGDLSSSPPSPPHSPREEPLELQVDFWKGTVKSSIKAFFRTLTIQRTPDNALAVSYILKEHKKQKIIRLGKKKEKETDVKNLSMDGISRLVCLAKSQMPIKLYVDGVEWLGVKFFQVSAQWQSQVKNLPLLVSSSSQGTKSSDLSSV